MQHPNLEIIYYKLNSQFLLSWNKNGASCQMVWLFCCFCFNLKNQNFSYILACCEVMEPLLVFLLATNLKKQLFNSLTLSFPVYFNFGIGSRVTDEYEYQHFLLRLSLSFIRKCQNVAFLFPLTHLGCTSQIVLFPVRLSASLLGAEHSIL